MTKSSDSTHDELEALANAYVRRLPTRIEQLETAIQALDLRTIQQIGHKIVGTGGSYGFQNLSQTARELEIYVGRLISAGNTPNPSETNQLADLVANLKAIVVKLVQNLSD